MILSIVIPSFKRPKELCELLNSIRKQKKENIEIIICEDCSPKRHLIRETVNRFKKVLPNLKYYENKKNIGYDANLRNVISKASGDYVVLSGDDDIFTEGSLDIIEKKIHKYNPVVLIRSYQSFDEEITDKTKFGTHRYVKKDKLVVANEKELAWIFYRSVLVSGLVLERVLAQKYATNIVDGTLYYQNYLITMISEHGPVLYVPDILVYNRNITPGDFGTAEIERVGDWIPGKRTIKSSLYQMNKFFLCAEIAGEKRNQEFVNHLKLIASAYSFYILSYHRDKGIREFLKYTKSLKEIGYGGLYFNFYRIILVIFNVQLSLQMINTVKYLLGSTIRLVK